MLTPRKLAGLAVKVGGQPEGLEAGHYTVNFCNVIFGTVNGEGENSAIILGIAAPACRLVVKDVTFDEYRFCFNKDSNTNLLTIAEARILYGPTTASYYENVNEAYDPEDHTFWDGTGQKPAVGAGTGASFSYPTPGWNNITVGSGDEDYSTIDAAYAAASDGDNIIISPGDYPSSFSYGGFTYMAKNLRFYGSTGTPADVILRAGNPNGNSWPIDITEMGWTDAAGRPVAPGFVSLTIQPAHVGYTSLASVSIY